MRQVTKGQQPPIVKLQTRYGEIWVSAYGYAIGVEGHRMRVNLMDVDVRVEIRLNEQGLVPAWGDRPSGAVTKVSRFGKHSWVGDVSQHKILIPVYEVVAEYIRTHPRFAVEGDVRSQMRDIVTREDDLAKELKHVEAMRQHLMDARENLGVLKERLRHTPKSS